MLLCLIGGAQSSNPVGDAFGFGDDCYVVTPNQAWQLGAVWFNEPVNLTQAFEIELLMNFGNNDNGADGMVFVFQQVGTNAIGIAGGGLGFEGFAPSLGIELDTYQNTDYGDPIADHMAFCANGVVNHNAPENLSGPVNMSAISNNVEDGQYHTFKITWDPSTTTFEVFFDCELRISYTLDVVDIIFQNDPVVYWGFTGATGGQTNEQSVCISEFALGLPDSYEICSGESIQLGVVGAENGSYAWTPAETLNNPNIPDPIATPAANTEYTVTFTDLCGEVTSLSTTVIVNEVTVELPEVVLSCAGDIVEVTAEGDADAYEWSNGDVGPTATESAAGPLSVTASTGNCFAEATTELVFHPSPVPLNWVENHMICEGESIILDAEATYGDTFEWSDGSVDMTLQVSESGIYSVTIFSSDDCVTTLSAEVEVIPFPSLALPDELSACAGTSVSLTSAEGDTFLWNTGDESQGITINESGTYIVTATINGCSSTDSTIIDFGASPQFAWIEGFGLCPDSSAWIILPAPDYLYEVNGTEVVDSLFIDLPGSYELTATDTSNGCSTPALLEVTALSLPILELPDEVLICDGAPAMLEAVTDAPDQMIWSDGSFGDEITIQLEGTYTATTSNACGSVEDQVVAIEARCDCPLFVPNAFTPDLDQRNERFYPSIDCVVSDYRFAIYNRWGELIFLTNVQGEGWNGSGPAGTHWVADGIYIWQLQYEVVLASGVEIVDHVGHVVVLR